MCDCSIIFLSMVIYYLQAYAIKTENDVKQIGFCGILFCFYNEISWRKLNYLPFLCTLQTEVLDEEPSNQIDLSFFSGNLCWDDHDNSRDCWSIPDGKNIKVRSKSFLQDKSKVARYFL